MTQVKEKTGICKSVVIATVVAVRDVVKSGFHCSCTKGVFFFLMKLKQTLLFVESSDVQEYFSFSFISKFF